MLFPTLDYFVFLAGVAGIHWAFTRSTFRTLWLLGASVVFYSAWNPHDLPLLLLVVAVAWIGGRQVAATSGNPRRAWLWASTLALVTPLVFFKYTSFVTTNLNLLFSDIPALPRQHLPIGISFYTFQAIAYVIDVSRGQQPERRLDRFTCFLLFFPHLVAGPILRAATLLSQLGAARALDREDLAAGFLRLGTGLIKKVLIADVLRVGIVDAVFMDPGKFTGLEVLVALYAYTLQIYCDFSGYTDFAIGSARLLGFRIPENFDRPYQALSVAEYWRRWHMTLSRWVQDYVYYPLGGSRIGGWRVYRNIMLTLLILAIWHGANWTFVVYGLIHGAAVSVNRAMVQRRKRLGEELDPGPGGILWRWIVTFHFVVLARILFRADDLAQAKALAAQLLDPVWALPRYSFHAWAVLILGYLLHLSPRSWRDRLYVEAGRLPGPVWGLVLVVVAWLCVELGVGDTLAFIYYEF